MIIIRQTLAATAITATILMMLCGLAHASHSAVDEMLLDKGCVKVAVSDDYPAGQWECPAERRDGYDRLPPVVPEAPPSDLAGIYVDASGLEAPEPVTRNKAPTRDMLSAAIEVACRKVGKSGNTSLCGEVNTTVDEISAAAREMKWGGS